MKGRLTGQNGSGTHSAPSDRPSLWTQYKLNGDEDRVGDGVGMCKHTFTVKPDIRHYVTNTKLLSYQARDELMHLDAQNSLPLVMKDQTFGVFKVTQIFSCIGLPIIKDVLYFNNCLCVIQMFFSFCNVVSFLKRGMYM